MTTKQSVAATMEQSSRIMVEGFTTDVIEMTLPSGMVISLSKFEAEALMESLSWVVEQMDVEPPCYIHGESCEWMPGMAECDELG